MLEAGLQRPPDVQPRVPAVAGPNDAPGQQAVEEARIAAWLQGDAIVGRRQQVGEELGGRLPGLAGPEPRCACQVVADGQGLGCGELGLDQIGEPAAPA